MHLQVLPELAQLILDTASDAPDATPSHHDSRNPSGACGCHNSSGGSAAAAGRPACAQATAGGCGRDGAGGLTALALDLNLRAANLPLLRRLGPAMRRAGVGTLCVGSLSSEDAFWAGLGGALPDEARELRVAWRAWQLGEWLLALAAGVPAGRALRLAVVDPGGALCGEMEGELRRRCGPVVELAVVRPGAGVKAARWAGGGGGAS